MGRQVHVLNVRVDDVLWDLIEKAAAAAEGSRSTWIRETLQAGALIELGYQLTARRVAWPAVRPLGSEAASNGGRCIHPAPARRQLPMVEECSLCGVVTRRRL